METIKRFISRVEYFIVDMYRMGELSWLLSIICIIAFLLILFGAFYLLNNLDPCIKWEYDKIQHEFCLR